MKLHESRVSFIQPEDYFLVVKSWEVQAENLWIWNQVEQEFYAIFARHTPNSWKEQDPDDKDPYHTLRKVKFETLRYPEDLRRVYDEVRMSQQEAQMAMSAAKRSALYKRGVVDGDMEIQNGKQLLVSWLRVELIRRR